MKLGFLFTLASSVTERRLVTEKNKKIKAMGKKQYKRSEAHARKEEQTDMTERKGAGKERKKKGREQERDEQPRPIPHQSSKDVVEVDRV